MKSLKAGQLEYRVDKYGIIHMPSGRLSFDPDKIFENVIVIMNALFKARPAAAKGTYMLRVTLSSSMGPGVRVDVNTIRTDLEDAKKTSLFS